MILDKVLNEQSNTFDQEDMVDMFVEGFLYALEMQENGQKAQSIEELSTNLSEAADKKIKDTLDSGIDSLAKSKDMNLSNSERKEHAKEGIEKINKAKKIAEKLSKCKN